MAKEDVVLLTLQVSNTTMTSDNPILGNGQRVAITGITYAVNSPLKMGDGATAYNDLPFIEVVKVETTVAYDLTASHLAVDSNEVSITNTGAVSIVVTTGGVNYVLEPSKTVTFRRINALWEAIYAEGSAGGIDAYDYFETYVKNKVVGFDEQLYIGKEGENLGNPPKVDRVVTGAYQAYTNLVQDPTDLRASGADWTSFNTTDELSTLSINGNLFTKITNSGAYVGNNRQTFTASFTNNNLIFSVIAKKGLSVNNVTGCFVWENGAGAIADVAIYWDNNAPVAHTGTIIGYTRIDSETLQLYVETIGLTLLTNDVFIALSGSTNATVDEYTYWSEVQLIDSDSITMFPFVDGTHSADVINETFTMPDRFTFDMIIEPKFAYDTVINHRLFSWYIDSTHSLELWYRTGSDYFRVTWSDGTETIMTSQVFNDGSTLTNINQRIRLIGSLDLKTASSQNLSRFIVIPLETGAINEDASWDSNPSIKSSTFPTLSIGWDNVDDQADSEYEYLRIYDGLLVGAVASSADVDTLLAGLVPLFETNNETPSDWWTPWPLNTGIENVKHTALDMPIIPHFIGQEYTNLVQDPIDLRAAGANWAPSNTTDELSTLSINGNLFTSIENSVATAGYNVQTITSLFSNLVLTGQVILKKGNSNTTLIRVTDTTAANTIFQTFPVFSNYPSSPFSGTFGVELDYEWIDSETIKLNFECLPLGALSNDITIRCYGSNIATAGDYTYWSEVQLIDSSSSTTMFPFVDGTHSADVINETFTMPDRFTFDMIIEPKFAFDDTTNRYILLWRESASELFELRYYGGVDQKLYLGFNCGTYRYLVSPQFDNGTSFTINQRLRIIGSVDLISGDINDSRFIVIPFEQGALSEDSVWSGIPDIKSTSFSTVSIGNYIGTLQADSEYEYLRIYEGLLVGAVNSSQDVTELLQQKDILFETIPNAFIPTEIGVDVPISSALQQLTDTLSSGVGIKDGAILSRHMRYDYTTTDRDLLINVRIGTMIFNLTQDRMNVRAANAGTARWEYMDGTDAT